MSDHSQVTIIKEPDGLIDREYLELAIKIHDSCSGVAIPNGESESMDIETSRGPADIEALMKTQEAFKEKRLILSLGHHPVGFPDDETQPFSMIKDSNDDEVVVAFLDGDFPKFAKKNSLYSSAYHFANDFLAPKLGEMYRACEGAMPEFMKKIQTLKKEIQANADPRGVVTIVTYDDAITPVSFSKNDLDGDYPEFWTSNSYGYDDEPEEEADDEADDSLEGSTSGTPVVAAALPPPKKAKKNLLGGGPVVAPGTKSTPVPENNLVVKKDEEWVMASCPTNIVKNKDIRRWYDRMAGTVPGNFKDRPQVRVQKSRLNPTIKSLQEIGDRAVASATAPAPQGLQNAKPPASVPNAEPIKATSEFFHIIPAEDQQKFFKNFAVRPDVKGNVEPEDIQGQEKRWATFCEITKVPDLIKVANWSDASLYLLIGEHKRHAFKLLRDLLRAYAISKGQQKAPTTEGVAPPTTGVQIVPARRKAL